MINGRESWLDTYFTRVGRLRRQTKKNILEFKAEKVAHAKKVDERGYHIND